MLKAVAQRPAEHRHQKLKASEVEANQRGVPLFQVFKAQSLADGHGKGVHTQAHGNQQQFKKSHYDMLPHVDSKRLYNM